ncbi:MAG: hypothetical protein AAF750_11310 [Planctomycetota bacterium]
MSERVGKAERGRDGGDDRELRGVFERLSALEPGEGVAESAVARARRAAAGLVDSGSVRGSESRGSGRGFVFWFWRLAMPAGVLTSVLVLVAVLWTSATPQRASAEEILERAAAAREAFVGWYTVEWFNHESGEWHARQRVNPVEGKLFDRRVMTQEDWNRPVSETGWVYTDVKEPLEVIYKPAEGEVIVTSKRGDDPAGEFPLTEQEVLSTIEELGLYKARVRDRDDGALVVEFVKLPVGEIEPTQRRGAEQHPERAVVAFDRVTGLLSSIAVQLSGEEELRPYLRIEYDTEPIGDWRDLVREGVKVVDQRPDEETDALLKAIDAVWDGGLGFDTALVVTRFGDRVKGTLRDNGWLALYGEWGDEYVKFAWKDGQDIAGWPKPTLESVLAHLETHPPDQVIVVAEGRCRWRWSAGEAWQERSRTDGRAENILRSVRLIDEVWPSRGEVFYDPGHKGVRPTVERDPARSNGVILEAVSKTRWQGTPADDLRVRERRRIVFLEDLGPLPIEDMTTTYDQDGEVWRRVRVEYSFVDTVMHRRPVRVPLYWVERAESPRSVTLPKFSRLLPQPGVRLDAKWFSDPTGRWPKEE